MTGGEEVVVPAPIGAIPVWVRDGSIVLTYPADHIADGLGDTPDAERPLVASLWGTPRKAVSAMTAEGDEIRWSKKKGWQLPSGREVEVREL